MVMELTKKEAELIAHFRRISDFNRQRLLALARNAVDDLEWVQKVRESQESQGSKSQDSVQ